MSVFKIYYYQSTPGVPHVYCRLYVAPTADHTYAGCGNFTVRAGEEFEGLRQAMSGEEFEGLRQAMSGVEFEDVTGKYNIRKGSHGMVVVLSVSPQALGGTFNQACTPHLRVR
jgi:hypothetical protein